MDFFRVSERTNKKEGCVIYPSFLVKKSNDFMVRGGKFYAIWDEGKGLWSTSEYDLQSIVDAELYRYRDSKEGLDPDTTTVLSMMDFRNSSWQTYKRYLSTLSDNFHDLDTCIHFSNDVVAKEDYCSKVLSYPLVEQPCPNYELLMSTLYDEEEREKLEWAIGSIFAGDSVNIQKFIVLYGDAGSGKSTFLHIVEKLFQDYHKKFEAKELGMSSSQFSTEAFRTNPLVAIQHDGDLSRIEDNTRLNSIISHESMLIHEKHKSSYEMRLNAFLFMGTNQPVKISDAKSGIIRRLIDVRPSGRRLGAIEYNDAFSQIDFELSGIAWHCLQVYKERGPNYYNGYTPIAMMYQTDHFFNFVEEYYYDFSSEEYLTLKRAWELYKNYCDEAAVPFRYQQSRMKEELKNYFKEYHDTMRIDGRQCRKVYTGFRKEKIHPELFEKKPIEIKEETLMKIELTETQSGLDVLLADCPAQYATEQETPIRKWENVTTTLKDLDTTKLHYVRPPENHIVIDFDLKDENGNKSAERNLEAAARWPLTYAEFSKGGHGVHLHYIYDGDVTQLSALYAPGIEVKVFSGKSSLRRKLSYCNDLPVAHLSSGLPLKEVRNVVNFTKVTSEIGLRELINKNLRKEIMPATKPSIDFIYKDLEAAYNSGLEYDVRDMRPKILAFANNSSHQSDYCVSLVAKMKFCSEKETVSSDGYKDDDPIVFYDLEVFPNLLIICWKIEGEDHEVVRMIQPTPQDVEELMHMKLIGFNNRRYDNHILYARYLGWSNEEIYQLSQRLISNSRNATFREAYNLSYADIYEFSSKKQSLKKFEIDLGIHHQENSYPWDQPLPEDKWEEVTDYCCNDVLATEATFKDRYSDFVAQEILADLTGMPVNSNGNSLAARLIFGNDRSPALVYTDLATGEASDPEYQRTDIITAFPGYELKYIPETKKYANMYRGTDVGFGGYVYAEPGMYTNVALIDIASMHPHSAIAMNYFGKYTKTFQDLVQARIFIKHKDYEAVRTLFDGRLNKYLEDETKIGNLAYSLKIVINKVYGLTSASFENEFRDTRNKNNIIALRGALFMRTLQDEIAVRGFQVAHIKTDSIKIPNATSEIINFCLDFAKKYGYTFEHEATYEKMCLVNDAVYIAKYASTKHCNELYGYAPGDNAKAEKKGKPWTATGAQFAQPFVFKTLFSREAIDFKDLCETKNVTSSLYLDYNENLPDVSIYETELAERSKADTVKSKRLNKNLESMSDSDLQEEIAKGHNYKFVGRIGLFTPITSGNGAAELMSCKDGKYSAAVRTKGYRWLESETVKNSGLEDKVDYGYYRALVDKAIETISKYGDFEWFVSDDITPSYPLNDNDVPWLMPCKDPTKTVCEECPKYDTCQIRERTSSQ